jgi:hypothetical protein
MTMDQIGEPPEIHVLATIHGFVGIDVATFQDFSHELQRLENRTFPCAVGAEKKCDRPELDPTLGSDSLEILDGDCRNPRLSLSIHSSNLAPKLDFLHGVVR